MASAVSLALWLALALARGQEPPDGASALAAFDVRNVTAEMLDLNIPLEAHNNSQCRDDSRFYREQALLATPWALQMYDASTKVPDGLLTGNVVQLGHFDECLSAHARDADGGGLFWGQYCLAGLAVTRLNHNATNATASNATATGAGAGGFKNHLLSVLAGRQLRWAVCLPASCSASDLQQHLQRSMPPLLMPQGASATPPDYSLTAVVEHGLCYRARSRHLDEADWAVILLMAVILGLVVVSTAYHITHPEADKEALVLAFSLVKNAPLLLATRAQGQMGSVNGVKFLSMAWVLLFHKYSVAVERPSVNNDAVLQGLKYDWTQMALSNGGTMAVNSFFVVGGLLLAHGFLRDRIAGRPFSLISFYVYRYIRLTPVYAVVVAVYATLLYHTGSGPLWNPVMAMHRENCRRHWWRNMLYINNYQPVTKELCVVQTWYLAADMQLYWLSPLLLWPLWRWPRAGRALLALLFAVPLASTFWIVYARAFPWADAKDVSSETRNSYFALIHASAFARAAPFLVGVALAWLLHATAKTPPRLHAAVVWGCWTALGGVSWVVLHALYIYYRPDHRYDALEAACFQALHPLAWGLLVAWLIYACERGYAGPVARVLGWRWWQPLSRLTYTAYLVHFAVFFFDLGVARAPSHFSHFTVVHELLGDLVLVMLLAMAAALAVELPVLNIDRALLRPKEAPGKKPAAASTTPSRLAVPALPANPARPSLRGNGAAPSHGCAVNVAFEDDLPSPAPAGHPGDQVTRM